MRVRSRIASPSADETSDDEPLLRPRVPRTGTGRGHPNVRQVKEVMLHEEGRVDRDTSQDQVRIAQSWFTL